MWEKKSAYEKRRRVENRNKNLGLRGKKSPARNTDVTVKWEKQTPRKNGNG